MKTLAGVLVGLALAVSSGGAFAATECNGPLSGTIVGGVVVNDGDFCVLGGANVSGGVQVNPGGILIICASTINGGIDANGAGNVLMGAEEIGCPGSVINVGIQISNTGPGAIQAPPGERSPPSIGLERSIIHGAVRLTGNVGPIAFASNGVAGGLFCADNAFDLDDEGMANIVTGKVTCTFGD